ncbi:hypothetical protein [Chelatococcus sp. XZ-Ab1]|uniref:hypothetical protein n=1 Tax=Chelatococcus sp. XZ-Ab1 TaxID=3034027 RepID=UPI0023E376CD|nr:hypothetical protein [Chelatococcus sp. XZ-Ab1]
MIAAIGTYFAQRLGRAGAIALAVAALLAVAGLGAWRATAAIERLVNDAATQARAARDAHWRAEIEASNAKVAAMRLQQVEAAMQAEKSLRDAKQQFEADLKELEEANAALAGGDDGGLGRDRVRLLNGAR